MSRFQANLIPSGISSSAMRYLQMLDKKEKPENVPRIIATHFDRRPASSQSESVESSSNITDDQRTNAFSFNINNDTQTHERFIIQEQPMFEQFSFQQARHGDVDQEAFGAASLGYTIPNLEPSTSFNMGQTRTSFASVDMFKSPPPKRKRRNDCSFDASIAAGNENFNFTVKPDNTLATEVLFGDESVAASAIFSQRKKQEFDEPEICSRADSSFKLFDFNSNEDLTEDESNEGEVFQEASNVTQQNHSEDLSESLLDESMMPKRCREKILEKSFMENQKINVSTIYRNRVIMKTSRQLIENYYKVQKFVDWSAVADEMAEMMEPSLDYVHARLPVEKIVTLGSEDQEIHQEDPYGCERIRESIEEIEQSFKDPDYSFVASTPNESRGKISIAAESPEKVTLKSNQSQTEATRQSQRAIAVMAVSTPRESFAQISHITNDKSQVADAPSSYLHFNLSNFDIGQAMESLRQNTAINTEETAIEEPEFRGFAPEEQQHISIIGGMNEILYSQDPSEALRALSQQNPVLADARHAAILTQIENIIYQQLESLVNQKPMVLKVRKIKNWNDCVMNNDVLSQKETSIATRSISFTNKTSERTFTIILVVMCEIYKMLARNLSCTKREIYYRDVELFGNQESVNKAVDTICIMLNVQEFELGVLSSSKGLVAGDLIINIGDERIDCTNPRFVPQNPSDITSFESNAEYVLVVEKDTVFQRFVNDKIFDRIGCKIVLITAKGYPDINTRMLLKKMSEQLRIPMYILVDADPHGVEIMCTYKHGSMSMVHNAEYLAVPNIEWIGIHPSDIDELDITNVELSAAELKKVDELLQRPYMNPILRRELNCFKARRSKAEIENVFHFSIDFLINDYIPRKMRLAGMPQLSQ